VFISKKIEDFFSENITPLSFYEVYYEEGRHVMELSCKKREVRVEMYLDMGEDSHKTEKQSTSQV